jgi:hypothetical protein
LGSGDTSETAKRASCRSCFETGDTSKRAACMSYMQHYHIFGRMVKDRFDDAWMCDAAMGGPEDNDSAIMSMALK